MNFQMLSLIGIILLFLCGFFLVLSLFLFFKFRIVAVIEDLTGRTAKKAIEKIKLDHKDIFEKSKILFATEKTMETTVLSNNKTTVLRKEESRLPVQYVDKEYFFNVEKNYIYINTLEEI